MHDSSVRLIRRRQHQHQHQHQQHHHRTGSKAGEAVVHARGISPSHERQDAGTLHSKRQGNGAGSNAEKGKMDESLVLKVLDAKAGGGDNGGDLAMAPLATQGASVLPPITLASYVTPVSILPTPLRPPSGMSTPIGYPSSSSLHTAPQQASPTVEQDNFIWPLAVGIMFIVLVLVYTLSIIRSLIHAISSGILRRGWYLRSSIPDITLNKACYARQPQRISKFRARARWFYNCFMLPTVPWINLTLGQCGVILIYFLCIIVALFIQSGGPIQDVIRSGRIAVAQYPFLFALATKNNLLGITGKSYEKLNFLHRFAGRSTLITGLVHSAVYLQKLDGTGELNLAREQVQWTGVVAGAVSLLILVTSFQFVRNFAYQVFMISHIIGWVALLVSSYMHVDYARPWVWASVAIMALDFILRMTKLRFKTATLHIQEGGVVRVELDDIKSGWGAGQHVWIRRLTAKSLLAVHPFSIANSAEFAPLVKYHLNEQPDAEGMVLYSKACGRWTKDLYTTALGNKNSNNKSSDDNANPFGDENRIKDDQYEDEKKSPELANYIAGGAKIKLLVDGPYGITFSSYTDFESVLLVAGGSGVTFILNALEEIVSQSIQSKSSTKRIKLIFTIREMSTVDSFLYTIEDILSTSRRACPWLDIQVEIYETSTTSIFTPLSASSPRTGVINGQLSATTPYPLLGSPSTLPLPKSEFVSEGMKVVRGERPNLITLLSHLLNDTKPSPLKKGLGGGVALITCGPISLIDASRKAAKRVDQNLAYRAGGVVVHSEKFGW